MTSSTTKTGTSYGPELLIQLRGAHRRAQLEERMRELVRDGTVPSGTRLPSSRALAEDLGVSRRLVVEAYAQLLAEGYLTARHGAGTYVAESGASAPETAPPAPPGRPRYDFFPGSPDLASFPRAAWLRATREVLRSAPPRAFAYPDPRGALELRTALAAYLRRVRGVVVEPSSMVICAGAQQGLALLARAFRRDGIEQIAVEDPGLPPHRAALSYSGLGICGVPVDEQGIVVNEISAPVVLTTPAHQCPTGVVLSPGRRGELVQWARQGGVVIEDDYDAEFRYDRAPLGALQGLAPEHVVYLGTASKTLAPGLRLGWMVLPASLLERVAEAKAMEDLGSSTLEQLTLARLLETAAYDRHLRRARRRNRARRDALVEAVAREMPAASVSGISAGLHALVRLPYALDAARVYARAAESDVGAYPLSWHMIDRTPTSDALVLGYANLSEPAIAEGIRRLAAVVEELGP